MLFSIHPMDGSLLIWHVDWLDEYQPGMFRQVQVLYFFLYSALLFSENYDEKTTLILILSAFLKIPGVICLKNSCCISDG